MRPQCCECVGALDRSPRSRGWTCIRARVLRRRGAQISDLPISPLSVLPSTRITVSALRIGISALDSPARMPRYRRFTDRLTTACARLAVRHGRPALCQRDFHPRPYSSLPGCSTLYHLSSRCGITPEQFWLIKGLVTQHSADHRQQTVSYRSQRPCMPMASKA